MYFLDTTFHFFRVTLQLDVALHCLPGEEMAIQRQTMEDVLPENEESTSEDSSRANRVVRFYFTFVDLI